MAKSSRSSSIKANNSALKSKVFSPVEAARTERLSAKLLALAAAPRPSAQKEADDVAMSAEAYAPAPLKSALKVAKQTDDMEVDKSTTEEPASSRPNSGRIEKRRSTRSRSSIVFPKYKNGKKVGTSKSKKR